MSKKVKRLITQFKPEHYDICIDIADDKKSLSGKATIRGSKIGRPSKRLTLHQKSLRINSVAVHHIDKKGARTGVHIERTLLHKSFDELRMHAQHTLPAGTYEIVIEYTAPITKNMDGVYPCFFEVDGQKKELIASQFESHHAREAFPCIDEPEAKATFRLTLLHASDEVALSNTPLETEKKEAERTTSVFEVTPIMSTYLVAFVIGDLKYKEAKSARGVVLRAYAVPDQIEYVDFALETAVKSLDFYEAYYDIPFPLAKCDFVALPDFASGAMENWGLITFREQCMLYDPAHTSLSTKQYVAIVVAHELTHQWFGNLVTMRWWTDLWLNEGFASWMEYLAIDTLFPEWNMWTQFAGDDQQIALKADSLEHTHPIEVPVKHPDEIRTIFDTISYMKGASVIHMLHDYLGPITFKEGLRHYLKKHAYQNTDTIDLWQALEDVSKKPVKQFMGAWTSQAGYPLVNVSYKHDHLGITQQRFVNNPSSPAREDTTLWPIPLLTGDSHTATVVSKRHTNVPIAAAPLKLNLEQTGFYRVDYTNELQARQLEAIDSGTLDEIDRMGLLSDGFEVARAGYQPITDYLDLLLHFDKENSLPVWELIAGNLGAIRSTLGTARAEDLREAMKPFIRKLVKNELKRLGWDVKEGESHLDSLLRPTIIALASAADDSATVKRALSLFTSRMDTGAHFNPDLRTTVYITAARKGGPAEFDMMLKRYKSTHSSDEKLSLTASMTSFKQPELHKKVLELMKTDAIKLQDMGYWLAYCLSNRHSRDITWEWMKRNWKWLKDNVGTDLSFARTPVYAARNFTTAGQLEDFKTFFSSVMEPMLERSFNQGVEIIETNTAWHKRDAEAALQWFKAQQA